MNTRYEEYTQGVGEPPFVLGENITRTPFLRSEKQNWHDNIEIQLCVEGEGYVLIDGKLYELKKGDIAVIDSNSIHYTYSSTSMTYSCIIVDGDFCERMGIDHRGLWFTPKFCDRRAENIFLQICEEYNSGSYLRIAKLNKLLIELLIEIIDGHSEQKMGLVAEKKDLYAVKKALVYIRENYGRRISLDDIARYALVDKYTLCKIFKRTTGQTVFENLNSYRCIKASEYISDGKTVSEAAYLCGFENNSFFTRIFKRYMGELPSKFAYRH